MKKALTIFASLCICIANAQMATDNSDQEKIKGDVKFATTAAGDGHLEVMLAKLAESKAVSVTVKTHAQHMKEDHSKANEELKNLADRKNISLPADINDKMRKEYDELNALTGKEFDKKFTKHMIKAHKKAICLFKKEAKKGKEAELKSWAADKVETLKGHLAMWKETCKTLKKEH